MAVLVEAARGNLESKTTAQAAGCYIDAQGRALGQPSGATGVTCQPGWFAAYYVTLYAVLEPAGAIQSLSLPGNSTFTLTSVSPSGHIPLRHPIGDGIAAAEDFFQILYNDADVHFGLVGFSDMVGSNNQSNHGPFFSLYQNVDVSPSTYPSDGLEPAVPYVPLSLTAGAAGSNYDTNIPPLAFPVNSVNDAIYNSIGNISNGSYAWTMPPYTVTEEGGTAIAAALNAAVDMILPTGKTAADGTPGLNLARPGATTAIVLFTDGLPNGGNDSGASDPDAQAAATTAGQNGIPIYTIGLSLIPGLEATQAQILTDTPGSSGIAALSGNGASFAQTTSATQLDAVFQSVARQLVQLVN